jgi:hypothetical protein
MANKKSPNKPADTTQPPAPQEGAPVTYSQHKPAKKYVSGQISLQGVSSKFKRADLVFDCIDHSGVSYEGRVYINNTAADAVTPKSAESGYAGSFHIFGHGGCFGDVGHCEVRGTPRRYDPRPSHQLTPAKKILIATEAIRKAISQGKEMTVTVVPIVRAGTPLCDYENVVKFERISVFTYR